MTRDSAGRGDTSVVPVLVDPELLRDVARSGPRQPSTAPTPEEVDVVIGLGELERIVAEHRRRVMCGEPHDWEALADALAEACRACRAQAPVELDDVGDAGSR